MLIEFRVSNYKSFRNVQVLSLKAGKVQKFSNRLKHLNAQRNFKPKWKDKMNIEKKIFGKRDLWIN